MIKLSKSPGLPDFRMHVDKWTELPKYARPGTFVNPTPAGFTYSAGGLGDYIAYTPALLWVAENCPWIHGTVYAPDFFYELAAHWFRGVKNWKVTTYAELHKGDHRKLMRAPDLVGRQQLVNGIGANLMRLGFIYYAGLDHVPEGITYPKLDLSREFLPKALEREERPWIVLTPAATGRNRTVPGQYWDSIIEHIQKLGMLPVLLGKEELTPNYKAALGDVPLEGVLDLRNQTTPLEAAAVMQYSEAVLGLDNGLIHLAACTTANIVCGYNIVIPEQRRPIRPSKGLWWELIPTEAELPCVSCQVNQLLLYTRNTSYCLYDEYPEWRNKCIDILFEDRGNRWITALDSILEESTYATNSTD